MKTCLSWLLVLLLSVVFAPQAGAQEGDDEGWETGSDEGSETGGETGGEEGGKKEDPWEAPETGETGETGESEGSGEAGTPEVVVPTGYPVAEIDRPLALPPMTLEPLFEFGFMRVYKTNVIAMSFGTGFGIMDNLEAGLLFPLVLSPDFDAGDMPLYGLYEFGPFMENKLRVAGRLTLNLPLQTDFGIQADAPVKFKLHEMFAVIGGFGLGMTFPEDNTTFWLNLDFGALVQPIEALAIMLNFGVHVGFASDTATLLPLYFRGQYTLIGDLDVYAEFGFFDLNNMGADWIEFNVGALYRIGL